MGKDEIQRPRVDYKARSRAMLDKFVEIAEEMTLRAHTLVKSGEDIRSNDDRPGVSTLQHAATKAIDEIVRLMPLAGVDNTKTDDFFTGVDFVLPAKNETLNNN